MEYIHIKLFDTKRNNILKHFTLLLIKIHSPISNKKIFKAIL